jgi:LuxR family transcriptional regulator, quorum-sensing system regulator LasR
MHTQEDMYMEAIEQFADLMSCDTLESWRNKVFSISQDLGYERTLLTILPDRNTPLESKFSFQHTNYSSAWLAKYDQQKMGYIDPTVAHVIKKTTPLIWSPGVFSQKKQKEMYEEANSYGLRAGVSLPIHGANGEIGIICFVSDHSPLKPSYKHVLSTLPALALFRDFIFESAAKFMKSPLPDGEPVHITARELECLKWGAEGKSSWEIGQILNCTEATVNFHFANIRHKLDTRSRQQAVVKAIRLGLISP